MFYGYTQNVFKKSISYLNKIIEIYARVFSKHGKDKEGDLRWNRYILNTFEYDIYIRQNTELYVYF